MHFTWEYTDKAKQVQFHFFTFPEYFQNTFQNISRTFAFNILQVQTVGPISPLDFYNQWVKPVWNIEDKICLVNSPFQLYNTVVHFNFTLVLIQIFQPSQLFKCIFLILFAMDRSVTPDRQTPSTRRTALTVWEIW